MVSVKFHVDVQAARRTQFYAEQQIQIVRENELGVVDIRVPQGKNPIEFVKELEATGLFEFAEVNVFGRYTKSSK